MTITPTTILCLAGAITLLGGVLVFLGWRGRRIGDHPFCRRCGFDLFGKADDSQVCSECGADLNRGRATVVGVRTPRRGVAWAGIALLVPAAMTLGLIGYGAARGVDWQKHKPAWWLAREAEGVEVAIRDAALSELLVRFGAGTLSKGQVADLIARGLRAQGDENRPWAVGWGDLIEQARAGGHVTDEQWKTYARQALIGSLTLRLRPRLRRGDSVPYRLDYGPARVGRRPALWQFVQIDGLTLDGVEVLPKLVASGMSRPLSSTSRGASMSSLDHRVSTFQDLADGPHRGTLKITARIADAAEMPAALRPGARAPRLVAPPVSPQARPPLRPQQQQQFRQQLQRLQQQRDQERAWAQERQAALQAYRDGTAPALVTLDIELPFEFELVEPGAPTVEAVIDPALRERVTGAITATGIRVMGTMLHVIFNCNPSPVDLSFDVFVRSGAEEWPAGTITCHAGDRYPAVKYAFPRGAATEGYDASALTDRAAVDVILRPSGEAAAQSPDIVRYWGEEIVLRGVPVENKMQAMQQRMRELRDRSGRTPSSAPIGPVYVR